MLTSEQKIILQELSLYDESFLARSAEPTTKLHHYRSVELLMLAWQHRDFRRRLSYTGSPGMIHYENVCGVRAIIIGFLGACGVGGIYGSYRLILAGQLQGAWRSNWISIILDDLTLERLFCTIIGTCMPEYIINTCDWLKKNRQCLYSRSMLGLSGELLFNGHPSKVHTAIPVIGTWFPSPRIRQQSASLKLPKQSAYNSVRQTDFRIDALRLLTVLLVYELPTMMESALELGYEVIGHIPKNRALYALSCSKPYPGLAPIKRKGRQSVNASGARKWRLKKSKSLSAVRPLIDWNFGFTENIGRSLFDLVFVVPVFWKVALSVSCGVVLKMTKGKQKLELFLSTNAVTLEAHEVLLAYSLSMALHRSPCFSILKHELWYVSIYGNGSLQEHCYDGCILSMAG